MCPCERHPGFLPLSPSQCSTRASHLLLLRAPCVPARLIDSSGTQPTQGLFEPTTFKGLVQMDLIAQVFSEVQPNYLRQKTPKADQQTVFSLSIHKQLSQNKSQPYSVGVFPHTHIPSPNLNSPPMLYFKQYDLPLWVTIRTKAKFFAQSFVVLRSLPSI